MVRKAGKPMTKSVLERFNQNNVRPALEQALINLEQDFQQNKEQMKQVFIDSFCQVCKNIKELQKTSQPKLGFLIFHLLRTKVLQHNYTYTAIAYDKEWYRREGFPVGEMDVSFIFEHYETMWKRLSSECKKYIMQIEEPDVERIMLAHMGGFHKYVVEVMRLGLLEALDTDEYQSLKKEDRFEIQAGEYYELCDLIHIEQKTRDLLEIKSRIQQGQGQACCFQDFRELDLSGFSCQSRDLRYADFRNSILNGANLSISLLMGTKFKDCTMKCVNLMFSMISDASFERADLTGTDLQYCVAFTGKRCGNQWKNTGFFGVSFKNSLLVDANFTGSTILGGDFEGADLRGAVFTDVQLYGSRFTQKQVEQCKFSQEQLEQMKIIP
jgi:hypothetical protein